MRNPEDEERELFEKLRNLNEENQLEMLLKEGMKEFERKFNLLCQRGLRGAMTVERVMKVVYQLGVRIKDEELKPALKRAAIENDLMKFDHAVEGIRICLKDLKRIKEITEKFTALRTHNGLFMDEFEAANNILEVTGLKNEDRMKIYESMMKRGAFFPDRHLTEVLREILPELSN
jgi:hypothetical protein